MMKLDHTIYIIGSSNSVLILNLMNKNLIVVHEDGNKDAIPLHKVEKIVIFGKVQVDDALCHYCAEQRIVVSLFNLRGQFKYRIMGPDYGNVVVRKQQYLMSLRQERVEVERTMIIAKLVNQNKILNQYMKNYQREGEVIAAVERINEGIKILRHTDEESVMRGIEGYAAKIYFGVFHKLVRVKEPLMQFTVRSRRPPKDPVNALLSFTYELLLTDCISALESVGIDPYAGFMHKDRPGKPSMALDIMEELRPLIADRFVIRIINLNLITASMFEEVDDGIYLKKEGKRVVLSEWNRRKKVAIYDETIREEYPRGLCPFILAQKLVRVIKGEESTMQNDWSVIEDDGCNCL